MSSAPPPPPLLLRRRCPASSSSICIASFITTTCSSSQVRPHGRRHAATAAPKGKLPTTPCAYRPPDTYRPPTVCHLTLHPGGLRGNKERPRLTGLSKEIVETGPWLIEGGKPTDRFHFFRRGVAWSPWGGGTWSTTGERSVKLKLCAARRSTRALWPRASSGPSGSEASRGLRGSGGRPRREA